MQRQQGLTTSQMDWITEIPEQWGRIKLKFTSRINPSKAEISGYSSDYKVSFLPMEKIGEDTTLTLDETKSLSDVKSGFTYFRDGDILIAKITPCFENGKASICSDLQNGIGFGTTELHVLRPSTKFNRKFLFFWTRSYPFMKIGEAMMYGSAGQKRVPEEFVSNFKIAYPYSVQEQMNIAEFLEERTQRINSLIAKKSKLINLLEAKRRSLINEIVTRGLDKTVTLKDTGIDWIGQSPLHWSSRKLSLATKKITNGYVGPTRDILVDKGVRYLQSLHIKSGKINFDGQYYVTEEWSKKHSKSILAEGDVLIVQTGAYSGECAAVPKELAGCNCHALIIVQLEDHLCSGFYLSYLLRSRYGYNFLQSIRTGALHPHLEIGYVKEILVLLPPINEQTAIVQYLDKQTNLIDALRRKIQLQIGKLNEYKDSLTTAVLTGNFDPKWRLIDCQ